MKPKGRAKEEAIAVPSRISSRTAEVEIVLGKQLSTALLASQGELSASRERMRRSFAKQYGFVVPDIRITDDISIPAKTYQIKIHGTVIASEELRIGDVLVITGDGPVPDVPYDEAANRRSA